MPNVVTPEEIAAVTAPYLEKIQPDEAPTLSREQELEQAKAALLVALSEANAKIIDLQGDVNMAMDALNEIAAGAKFTVTQIFGAEIV